MFYMLAGTNESVARAVTSDVGCVLGSHVKSGIGISHSAHWDHPIKPEALMGGLANHDDVVNHKNKIKHVFLNQGLHVK